MIPGRRDAGLLLLCDHARNAIPGDYGTLGLPADQLERHIAYDIGAEASRGILAQKLGAPAICTRFSRLLIDPNRGLDDPTLIMRISDGAVVPGNRHVDAAERDRRVRHYYEPYHLRIDSLIEQCVAAGVPPVLLSVHSFTDSWKGTPRPWHAAILWDRDYRFSVPLLEALRAEAGIAVGENEPYDGKLAGDCMWQHGTRRGLAHTIVEVRQDLIRSAEGQRALGASASPPPCRPCLRATTFAKRCIACSTSARTPTPKPRRRSRARRKGTLHDRHRPRDRNASSRPPPFAGSSRICASAPTCRTST